MRTFLLEPVGQDLRGAQAYGKINYLFREGESRPSVWDTQEFIRRIQERLTAAKYDPARDYVVLTGGVLQLFIVVAAVCGNYETALFLLWDSKESKYLPRALGANNAA